MQRLKLTVRQILRRTERYTKTDMVYLFSSSSWMNLNFLFVSICSFALSIAFANLVSKDDYGTYQYVLSFSAILTAFTFTGFGTAITQSVARGFEGTLRSSIRPQVIWNLIPTTAGLILSSYYFISGQEVLAVGILAASVSVPVIAISNSYASYLSGKEQFKAMSLYVIASNALYYLFIFACIFTFPKALPLLLVNLAVTALASVFFYRRTLKKFPPGKDSDPEALSYARHLSLVNILGGIASNIDKLLIFHFLGPAVVALYAIATLLPERLGGVLKSITSAALPRFAHRNLSEVQQHLGRRLLLFLLLISAISLLYVLIAPPLFRIIYPDYISGVSYSQLYSLTLISAVGAMVNTVFYAKRKVQELYVLNTIVPVIQIIAQVIGIVFWGLGGLIVSKIVSAFIGAIGALILFYRARS